jgi:hypothetical protein
MANPRERSQKNHRAVETSLNSNSTRCKECALLRYRGKRIRSFGCKNRYIEILLCDAAHYVTVADLNRVGSCPSFKVRNTKTKEVKQEKVDKAGQLTRACSRYSHNEEKMMAIKAKVSAERKPIAEGTHIAVCTGMYELGTQHSIDFNSDSKQLHIIWELADEEREYNGEKYRARVSKTYNQSLNSKSNLRRMVESWRGSMSDAEALEFDISSLAGQPCLVTTTNVTGANGKTNAKVSSVSAIPRGMAPPQCSRPPIVYEVGDPLPEDTPKWIAEKIAASPEFSAAQED